MTPDSVRVVLCNLTGWSKSQLSLPWKICSRPALPCSLHIRGSQTQSDTYTWGRRREIFRSFTTNCSPAFTLQEPSPLAIMFSQWLWLYLTPSLYFTHIIVHRLALLLLLKRENDLPWSFITSPCKLGILVSIDSLLIHEKYDIQKSFTFWHSSLCFC